MLGLMRQTAAIVLTLGLLAGAANAFDLQGHRGARGLSPENTLAPDDIAAAKALGLKVIPWTVNERADMERLIALGVDGIITDYPDRLRAVMAAKDMPLPPQVGAR